MPAPRSTSSFRDAARDALALSLVPGVGPKNFHDLVAAFGTARGAFDDGALVEERVAAYERADAALTVAEGLGAELTLRGDERYPASLTDLGEVDAPALLWSLGDWAVLADPVVAIVGTRRSTAYGERVTREIAAALARAGACVVSGLARGIDATAHRAALAADGRTVAVLGTGVDIAYPVAHRALHAEIRSRGLLLSELPIGERAHGGSFPRRNRIIAALSAVTIVVEAGARSGAIITANRALDLGRTLAAVPGPIDSPQSEGSNLLIRDGAVVIASVADALALAGLTAPARRAARDPETADEVRVWAALDAAAESLDALYTRAGLPLARCLAAVTALELRGAIECALTGEIRRR